MILLQVRPGLSSIMFQRKSVYFKDVFYILFQIEEQTVWKQTK